MRRPHECVQTLDFCFFGVKTLGYTTLCLCAISTDMLVRYGYNDRNDCNSLAAARSFFVIPPASSGRNFHLTMSSPRTNSNRGLHA